MRSFILLPAILLLASAASAKPQIVSSFGNKSCLSTAIVSEYAKTRAGLLELTENGGPHEEIERHQLALEILTPGVLELAKSHGLTVVARFDSAPQLVVPSLEIDGQSYPYASVSGVGSLIQVTFTGIGVCAFANPKTGSISDAEIVGALELMAKEFAVR